uniref:Uncharacterized protein n=1 Tax=Strix occidentalis caurina TaxID=311401 RepID=A0A8D0FID3_STROC
MAASEFVVFLSDTDEYRPPVWKSYCKTSECRLFGRVNSLHLTDISGLTPVWV